MRLLPNGNYEIRNKRTGQVKEVSPNDLPKYGLSAPRQAPQPEPQQSFGEQAKGNAGVVGSIGGGMVAPWPLSILTTGAGAYGGKRVEQDKAPIPTSPAQMLFTKLFDPELHKKLYEKEYSPEAMGQDTEALKYGAEQAGTEAIMGGLGKLLGKLGGKVKGGIEKIGIKSPKGIIRKANQLSKEAGDEITKLLTEAQSKGGSIKTKPIISKLDDLIIKYGPKGTNTPEYVRTINKVKDRLVKNYGDFISIPETKDLLSSNELRKLIGSETWGATGKEMSKTGAGKAQHTALKMTGGDIRDQLVTEVQKTIGKGSTLDKLFKEQGIYTNLARGMSKPLQPSNAIGSLSLVGSLLGLGGPFAPIMGAYGATKIPYINYLGKELIGTGLDIAGKSSSPLAKLLADYENKQNNPQ